MSNTRTAEEGSQLRPDRFTSSVEYSGAINATVAAKRIALVDDQQLRELLWFVQWRSLAPRGLKALANELLARFPERIGTPAMRRMKLKRGRQVLSRDSVMTIRKEFPCGEDNFRFPGELSTMAAFLGRDDDDSDTHNQYCAEHLFERIDQAALSLPEHFVRLCCDPEIDLTAGDNTCCTEHSAGVWYFDDLLAALALYRRVWIRTAEANLAETEISRQIIDGLDFCYCKRKMILIEGVAGVGKSATVKAWCNRFPGVVRYVEIPSSNDDRSFYAAIAESLGVAQGESYNTQQIKLRVEKALRVSGILLVLDEAQFAWPQTLAPRGIPMRMQWIKTVYDAGTPIALIGLPDFTLWQQRYVRKTLWNGDQLDRRLNRRIRLPLAHSLDDLKVSARAKHPHGDAASWKMLAGYALMLSRDKERDRHTPDPLPNKQASAITEVIANAAYIAEKDGRDRIDAADIKAAIRIEFPSAFDDAGVEPDGLPTTDVATVQNDRCNANAQALQERPKIGSRFNRRGEIPATKRRSRIADSNVGRPIEIANN